MYCRKKIITTMNKGEFLYLHSNNCINNCILIYPLNNKNAIGINDT